ncbi:MAG: cobyrinate a,c-diamide synthase [Pseudomonadota bacterium]
MKAVLIGGAASGAGKTTLTLALIAAARRRGLNVQPFKVGPDFIDPGHHALAAGRVSHNLDGWMLPPAENRAIFARHAANADQAVDLAVIEGVMGLYDGFSPVAETGSSAEMAKLMGAPVLLTVNARSQARSIAALAQGFYGFDPSLAWAGLIANQLGGPSHAAILREAMTLAPGLAFWGGLPRRPELALGERHLGLVTAEDGGLDPAGFAALADWLEDAVDLDALLAGLPDMPQTPAPAAGPAPAPASPAKVRIGVAKDRAFCFYYAENLRRLAAAGAELAPFSPLSDPGLPAGLHGLYLGGGYPELHAPALAANAPMLAAIRVFAKNGGVIYAECGGMMYLANSITDLAGQAWPLAGVLDLDFRMLPQLKSLGYRQVFTTAASPLGPAGVNARGHEFHYSEPVAAPAFANIYQAQGRRGPEPGTFGLITGHTLASYVHLHFGSNPNLAPHLVAACARGGFL